MVSAHYKQEESNNNEVPLQTPITMRRNWYDSGTEQITAFKDTDFAKTGTASKVTVYEKVRRDHRNHQHRYEPLARKQRRRTNITEPVNAL